MCIVGLTGNADVFLMRLYTESKRSFYKVCIEPREMLLALIDQKRNVFLNVVAKDVLGCVV